MESRGYVTVVDDSPRRYDRTLDGEIIDDALAAYREQLPGDSTQTAGQVITALSPQRVQLLAAVDDGKESTAELQEVPLDNPPVHVARPLVEAGVLDRTEAETQYDRTGTGDTAACIVAELGVEPAADVFDALKLPDTWDVVAAMAGNGDGYDSIDDLADDIGTGYQRAYDRKERLADPGVVQTEGAGPATRYYGTAALDRVYDAFKDYPVDRIQEIGRSLQTAQRTAALVHAADTSAPGIAEETRSDRQRINQLMPELEDAGLVDIADTYGVTFSLTGDVGVPTREFIYGVADPAAPQGYADQVEEQLLERFPGQDAARDAVTIAAVLLNGGKLSDAEEFLDISYNTALNRLDDLLIGPGLVEKEGGGRFTEYHLDQDFADDVQRYLEVYEPAAALQLGSTQVRQVEDDTALRTRIALNTPGHTLAGGAEVPDPFDIWPQLDEFMAVAHSAATDSTISHVKDLLGTSRGAVKDRLSTLEEKGALKAETHETGASFIFSEEVRPVVAEYADQYAIPMDRLAFRDMEEVWREDLFEDDTLYEDMLDFATISIESGGIASFRRRHGLDQEEAKYRFERLVDRGVLRRSSSSREFLFDQEVRPLLRLAADRIDPDVEADIDPMDHLRFRDLENFGRSEYQDREENSAPQEMTFRDYDGGGDTGGDPTPNGGVREVSPDGRLDAVEYFSIEDGAAEGLIEDVDRAVQGADDPVAAADRRVGDDVYVVEPRNVESSVVAMVASDGTRFQMEGKRYRDAVPVEHLSDGFLLVSPGEKDSLTGFHDVDEIYHAVRPAK